MTAGPRVGQLFPLVRHGATRFGRSAENEISIDSEKWSRYHALIEELATGYQISDLNSFNGTLVNGERVTSTMLSSGDRIEIGDVVFKFRAA